jgi:hypothetical protein
MIFLSTIVCLSAFGEWKNDIVIKEKKIFAYREKFILFFRDTSKWFLCKNKVCKKGECFG